MPRQTPPCGCDFCVHGPLSTHAHARHGVCAASRVCVGNNTLSREFRASVAVCSVNATYCSPTHEQPPRRQQHRAITPLRRLYSATGTYQGAHPARCATSSLILACVPQCAKVNRQTKAVNVPIARLGCLVVIPNVPTVLLHTGAPSKRIERLPTEHFHVPSPHVSCSSEAAFPSAIAHTVATSRSSYNLS